VGITTVAPDGERFLFAKAVVGTMTEEGRSPFTRIVVVQNWHEELKRLVPTK
jgi:hypothetical protein